MGSIQGLTMRTVWQGEQYEEPWFILTDLSPTACAATWYGLRSWCEQGFKCNKRGAWQWQHTRMCRARPPAAADIPL